MTHPFHFTHASWNGNTNEPMTPAAFGVRTVGSVE
jgi:hypothetical protein